MGNSRPANVQVETVKSIWEQYRAQAVTSRRLKSEEGRWRQILLVATIAALLTTPFSKTFERGGFPTVAKGLVVVATLLFALIAWLNKDVLGDDTQRPWVRARQTGEGLKSLAFRFLGGVPPFDGVDSATAALKRAADFVTQTGVAADKITDEERVNRLPHAPLDATDYITDRLENQVAFFEDAADDEKRIEARIVLFGRVISLSVAAFGAVSAFVGQEWRDIWAPALGVAGTMITTQMVRSRHHFLVESYSNAALKLRLARGTWNTSSKTDDDVAKLFSSVETILSDEIAGWVQQMLIKPVFPEPASTTTRPMP